MQKSPLLPKIINTLTVSWWTMAKNENSKVVAVLSYILIGIIWYFVDEKMQKNTFVKFHVKQGLVLLITSVVIWAVGSAIPVLGWFIILPIGHLLVLVLAIIGMITAAQGKTQKLWLIGQFAKHFTF